MRIEPAPLPDGANLIETVPFSLTHRMLREVMRTRGCLEVAGEAGSGKTFCVDHFFSSADHDVVKIHLEGVIRGYAFLRRLVRELGGSPIGDGEALMKELRRVVGNRRVYAYVDEANNLNLDSLRQIRFIRDQRELHIVFVLVGTDFRRAYRLVPELWSRVTRRTTFSHAEGPALVALLASYHPFLAAADASILLQVDAQHCRGNWRVWSEVLPTLIDYARRMKTDGLTLGVAKAVLGVTVDQARAKPRGTKARHQKKAA